MATERIGVANVLSPPGGCRLCGGEQRLVGELRMLGLHPTPLSRCLQCDLLQTGVPYWLGEAYTRAITRLDTGAMTRCLQSTRIVLTIARILAISPSDACLDFGGGHGVFVRLMRDLGFDFRWMDRCGENLFAAGFEGGIDEHHRMVTAFEVLEHLDDVSGELERLFGGRPDVVVASTLLHSGDDGAWWYLTPETGQHIAFYSARTMAHIGERFGYRPIVTPELTVFLRLPLPFTSWRVRLLEQLVGGPRRVRHGLERLAWSFGRYRSRSQSDFDHLRKMADGDRRPAASEGAPKSGGGVA